MEFLDLVKIKEKTLQECFRNSVKSFQLLLTPIMDNKLSVNIF